MSVNEKVNSILFVEDSNNSDNILKETLKLYCNNLYCANNGMEGLELYKKYYSDIIISDIKMPIMNGIEMAKKIKEIDKESHVIFTTTYTDTEYLIDSVFIQNDGYLIKPIKLNHLEKKITTILNNIKIKNEIQLKNQFLLQQSKLATMGEMLANVSHQWKQPLNFISLSTFSLRKAIEKDNCINDGYDNLFNSIDKQIKYLKDTLQDFTNYLKPTRASKESININDTINKCINIMNSSFKEESIQIIKDIDPNLYAYGSNNFLQQAIMNILCNAKDALVDKSKKDKIIFLSVSLKEDNVLINIKDTAGGIDDNIINNIFQAYFTTKDDSIGTGLGLHITHDIIKNSFDGDVWVENEKFEYNENTYKGASFYIEIANIKCDLVYFI